MKNHKYQVDRSDILIASIVLSATLLILSFANQSRGIEDDQNKNLGFAAKIARLELAQKQFCVPVGGIIMWWGSADAIPPGFELCDDKKIGQDAVITSKPDLQDKFVKGVAAMENLGHKAGKHKNSHSHSGTSGGANAAGPSQGAKVFNNDIELPHKEHVHTFTTGLNSDNDEPYNNAPEFVSLHFIIRTR